MHIKQNRINIHSKEKVNCASVDHPFSLSVFRYFQLTDILSGKAQELIHGEQPGNNAVRIFILQLGGAEIRGDNRRLFGADTGIDNVIQT